MKLADRDRDSIRADRVALEQALRDAGCNFIQGGRARCPFHEDHNPSATVRQYEGGVWRFHCFPCDFMGDVFDVRAKASGKNPGDVMREEAQRVSPAPRPAAAATARKPRVFPTLDAIRAGTPHVVDVYPYTDPVTNEPDMVVARVEPPGAPKRFLQYRPVLGGFEESAPPKPWPLFNRIRLRDADEVWVVEGEKCVKAMTRAGVVATTSPGGAMNGHNADWSPLAGKRVLLWPDNDPVDPKSGKSNGIEHMRQVSLQLERLTPAPSLCWIDPGELDLPPKGDAADYLEPCGTDAAAMKQALDAVKGIATPTGAAAELDAELEAVLRGERRSVDWPWPCLTRLCHALTPGTVTCLCGDPGSGKSLFVLESAWVWHRAGVPVAVYELEDDRVHHLRRALAQWEENGAHTSNAWCENNPEAVREAKRKHWDLLDSFGRCLYTPEGGDVDLEALLAWVVRMCEAKRRVIVIDPVTAADSGDKPWLADRQFIMRAKAVVRRTGSSLLLVTHPKLGVKAGGSGSALHGMAGGAAYPRFAHSVLWLYSHEQPRRALVRSGLSVTTNRTVKIGKARNGPGQGVEIAYHFDALSLRYSEQGAVVRFLKQERDEETSDAAAQ